MRATAVRRYFMLSDVVVLIAATAIGFALLKPALSYLAANPIRLIQELFRLTRPGGHVILAAPDKRYTFDHERALTTPEHLWTDFRQAVTENSDDHYWDFIRHVVPHVLQESPENQKIHLQRCRDRGE